MKSGYINISLAALLVALLTTTAQAQNNDSQEIEEKLKQRDKIIIELIERVKALELRVGVQRPKSDPNEPPDQDIAPNIKRDLALPPGTVVIEEGATERALERSLTREGALLLPSGVLEIEPSVTYTRNEDTNPGFVTISSQIYPTKIERNAISLTPNLALRLGLPWESQLELGIPYRWRQIETVTKINFVPTATSKQSDDGLGDLRIGLAKTMLREGLWRPDLVGRFTWDTDTGEIGGYNELRGSLTAIKRQDPITFIGGLSYEQTLLNDAIKPGSAISANFGSIIALSPEASIRFFLSGRYQNESEVSGLKIVGSDRTVATFIIGGSTLLGSGTLLNLSAGIGLTDDADNFTLTLSLIFRMDERLF